MSDYIKILFLGLLNKLSFFLKLVKNSITYIISNTSIFKVNCIINKIATKLFIFD